MREHIKISIITPCFNAAPYIESAILSVISQPFNDIEMIVVDDGSVDNTQAICKKYHNSIRYYRTENLGAGHARNYAIDQAQGTWLIFLDADDFLLHNALNEQLSTQLDAWESNGIDVVYTPWIYSDISLERTLEIRDSEPIEDILHIPKHEFWTCLYRRAFLTQHRIRFYEYREQDIASAFRYLVFSQKPNAITRNDIRFLLQRNNPNSNTHTWNSQVMHAIKALVYQDLYSNHSVEKSRLWLLESVLEQIYLYYSEILRSRCSHSELYRAMNQLVKICFSQCIKNHFRVHGKKRFLKSILFWIVSKWTVAVFPSSNNSITSNCPANIPCEDSFHVIERLKKVSSFVKATSYSESI